MVACVAAAVLMLGTALILRGTPFRGLLSHSFKPSAESESSMRMQPGGAVTNESPNPQAPLLTTAAPNVPQSSPTSPVTPPSATSAASSPDTTANQLQPANPPAETAPVPDASKAVPRHVPTAIHGRSSSTIKAPASTVFPKTKNLPVRNNSVLAAKQHFGDQFIGHLDLAGSGDQSSSSPDQPLPGPDAKPVPATPSPEVNSAGTPSASIAPSSSPAAQPPRASAITGSISTSPAVATPVDRSLQITFPAASRASYVNLPGEQIVQSPTFTLHIQRAVLAPASSTASSGPRKETVVVGDLLSHVDPHVPRLTSETGNRVGVRAFLTSDGRVEKLMPVNGSVALVSSAARAIREWRFQPTLLAGQPVPMAIYVLVEFHPEQTEHP
jgi:hypothetical protein